MSVEKVLCDTSVFVALREQEPSLQRIPTTQFFLSAESCHYYIISYDGTIPEISSKFPYFMNEFNGLAEKLSALKKYSPIPVRPADSREILRIYGSKMARELGLSFRDCAFAYYAEKLGVRLVTWDSSLFDYCEANGIKASRPDELVILP